MGFSLCVNFPLRPHKVTISILGFQFGLYHVVVALIFLRNYQPCYVKKSAAFSFAVTCIIVFDLFIVNSESVAIHVPLVLLFFSSCSFQCFSRSIWWFFGMSLIQTWCVHNRRVFGTGKYYPVFLVEHSVEVDVM